VGGDWVGEVVPVGGAVARVLNAEGAWFLPLSSNQRIRFGDWVVFRC